MSELKQAWWISWYHWKQYGEFELHNPWWVSGWRADGSDTAIIVAAVRADTDEDAYEIIRQSYDVPPVGGVERRFCDRLTRSTPWSEDGGRFPRADWMQWEDE